MSHNINSNEVLVNTAWMYAEDVVKLLEDLDDNLPESCFLKKMEREASVACRARKQCLLINCKLKNEFDARFCKQCGTPFPTAERVKISLPNLWWYGEGSGYLIETLFTNIAPYVHGEVQALFIWEGGDIEGIAIKDGKWCRPDVETKLVMPEGW